MNNERCQSLGIAKSVLIPTDSPIPIDSHWPPNSATKSVYICNLRKAFKLTYFRTTNYLGEQNYLIKGEFLAKLSILWGNYHFK